jgi:hypothetical protein
MVSHAQCAHVQEKAEQRAAMMAKQAERYSHIVGSHKAEHVLSNVDRPNIILHSSLTRSVLVCRRRPSSVQR